MSTSNAKFQAAVSLLSDMLETFDTTISIRCVSDVSWVIQSLIWEGWERSTTQPLMVLLFAAARGRSASLVAITEALVRAQKWTKAPSAMLAEIRQI